MNALVSVEIYTIIQLWNGNKIRQFLHLLQMHNCIKSFLNSLLIPWFLRDPPELDEYDSAREAEKGQREFAEKIEFWDYILLLGMFFVAIGGIIVTLLMVHGWLTYELYVSRSEIRMYKPGEVTQSSKSSGSGTKQQYGAIN